MDVLLQMQADQLGVTVARPTRQETTALGAAYLAGLAEGVWPDLAAVGAQWRTRRRVPTRPATARRADAVTRAVAAGRSSDPGARGRRPS